MTKPAYRILLVDDEPAIRTVCKMYLENMPNITIVGEAENANDAKILIEACKPNLVLLDIQMGAHSGFDVLAHFPNPNFEVIFITAYEQYALKAIKAGALDYLLKPIVEKDFLDAIQKAIDKPSINFQQIEVAKMAYVNKTIERITLSANDGYHLVWVKDIMYCSANGNYTTFHICNGKQIMVSKIIKEYEVLLYTDAFLRVHQSYLVNMRYVVQFTKDNALILSNNAEIIVSLRKKEDVIQWLKRMA
jgi:two-component system LytT family response regulator